MHLEHSVFRRVGIPCSAKVFRVGATLAVALEAAIAIASNPNRVLNPD
jgi:hypothetical protein